MGWLTTGLYFVSACLCLRAFVRTRRLPGSPANRRLCFFWCGVGLLLVALGVNKQLDLQTLLTDVGRSAAKSSGWYEQKRGLQLWFVCSVAVLGSMSALGLGLLMRGTLRQTGLACAGVVMLVCFMVLRASSFHHVDYFLCRRLGAARVAHVFELTGIVCVGASAALSRRSVRQRRE